MREWLLHGFFVVLAICWALAGLAAVMWANGHYSGPAPPEAKIPI